MGFYQRETKSLFFLSDYFSTHTFWKKAKIRIQFWYCTFFVYTILNFPHFWRATLSREKAREIQKNEKYQISILCSNVILWPNFGLSELILGDMNVGFDVIVVGWEWKEVTGKECWRGRGCHLHIWCRSGLYIWTWHQVSYAWFLHCSHQHFPA